MLYNEESKGIDFSGMLDTIIAKLTEIVKFFQNLIAQLKGEDKAPETEDAEA